MFLLETRNADDAAERVSKLYGHPFRVERADRTPDFHLRLKALKLGAATLVRGDTVNFRVMRETRGSVVIDFSLNNGFFFQAGRMAETQGQARHALVSRPYETYGVSIPNAAGVGLILPVQDLLARAERLADKAFGDSLINSMVDDIDLRTPAARALSRGMKIVMAEMSDLAAVGLERVIAGGSEDILSNLAVACLFPQLFAAEGQSADCGPRVVRRARDYLRQYASEPIELARLAADLGVSMRSLQENFRRYYGTSPRNFIIDCRLERARQRLLAAAPGDSVTLIAAEAGFGDLGGFAAKYREKFGEAPSQTLRNARG